MLKISNLKITYGDQEVIKDASLEFQKGITCLIGESGCGKTSILNALNHQINFEASSFVYNEIDLLQKDSLFFKNNISYLTQQDNFISDLTCYENIRLFASFAGVEVTDDMIQSYLDRVGLSVVNKNSYPDELSGGEKQKLAVVQALAKNTSIILCDEITASLDADNKIEIFNLLNSISEIDDKIIIITSHDEDIYNISHSIYLIEDGNVTLKKQNILMKPISSKEKLNSQNVSLKILNTYIMGKLNRQRLYSVLYSLITALVVSICAFLTFFTYTSLSEQRTILDRLCENQIYIINQTSPTMDASSYSYYPNNQSFDHSVLKKIQSINGVDSVYPYYWVSLVEPQAIQNQQFEITVSYENKPDKNLYLSAYPYDFCLTPYNKEQEFEKRMAVINDENREFGVYVNYLFLTMTGLTEEDLIGATLKLTVYPPVAYTKFEIESWMIETNEKISKLIHEPIGAPIEIEVPVLGFVDFWYNEDWAKGFIYCPIDFLEDIRNQVNKDYLLNEGEYNWMPNAYISFVEDLEKMEEVNIEIRNIDKNIATGNKYTDNTAMYKQNRYIEITALVAIGIVLLTGMILSFVYGIYHYQQQEKDVNYFKRNGFSRMKFKHLLLLDCLYQVLINSVFALPIVVLISYFGQIKLNMFRFGLISMQSLVILILMIVYVCIQTVISRIYYYRKITKKEVG